MGKTSLFTLTLCMLLAACMFLAQTSATISVGAKKGDWIQYTVSETGNVTPDYNITWARIDVTKVEDTKITVDVQTGYANGTLYPKPHPPKPCNRRHRRRLLHPPRPKRRRPILQRIPRQHNPNQHLANAGSGTSAHNSVSYHKPNHLLLGPKNRRPRRGCYAFPTFVLFTRTSGTNLWQPQTTQPDATLVYVIATLAAVAAALAAGLLLLHRRVRTPKPKN